MHLFHVPQSIIQNSNVHISALNGALRDMEQMHYGMCELGQYLRVPNPSWWRHQMETSSALLAICAGNSPVSGEFPAQRPVTRSFDVFFDVRVWINTREAGHLRRYRIHYDVIVM